jgi:GntR family transcriptional regulator
VICEANEKVAELLDIERGTAVFKIKYQGADKDYNVVEYTKSYMNPAFAEFRFLAEEK